MNTSAKFSLFTIGLLSTVASSYVWAAPVTEEQLTSLQKQLTALQKQVEMQKPAKTTATGMVGVGPLYGYGDSYAGWDLLVNTPSTNKDWSLIKRQQESDHYLKTTNPAREYLRISGDIDNTIYRDLAKNSDTLNNNYWSVGGHLDLAASTSNWVNVFTEFKFSHNDPDDDKGVVLNNAFVTLGNFDETPFYGSIGKMYAPFGNYSTFFWSDPLTKQMGRFKDNLINVGYAKNGWIASIYLADTPLKTSVNSANIHDTGISVRKTGTISTNSQHKVTYNAGVGVNSSFGIGDDVYHTWDLNQSVVSHLVPGVAVDAKISVDSFDLISEYVGAAKKFKKEDLSIAANNPNGARPQSYRVEGAYRYQYKEHPGAFAIAYDRSLQSAMLVSGYTQDSQAVSAMPRYRYGAALSYSPFHRVVTTLEFLRGANYSTDAGGAGGFSNTYTFDVDCFF